MRFYRNPEIRRQLVAYILITLIAVGAAWGLTGARGALIMLIAALVFTLMHFHTARRRYRILAELSDSIDAIFSCTSVTRKHTNRSCIYTQEDETKKIFENLNNQIFYSSMDYSGSTFEFSAVIHISTVHEEAQG